MNELECFVDEDFLGNYVTHLDQTNDLDSARRRYGWVIRYLGVPISWVSRLQSLIALSSTESEYVALSESVRTVIPIMRMLLELKVTGFLTDNHPPTLHFTFHEDNSGSIELITVPKVRAHTKHIHLRYHHFVSLVKSGVLVVRKVRMNDQGADILTKPLGVEVFHRLRQKVMGE